MPSVPPLDQLWLNNTAKSALPTSGPRFDEVMRVANIAYGEGGQFVTRSGNPIPAEFSVLDLAAQESTAGAHTVAKAYAFLATGDQSYANEVRDVVSTIMFTENGARTLALGRNIISYVVAADLIGLRLLDPVVHERFRGWLRYIKVANIYEKWQGEYTGEVETIQSMTDSKPNNWSYAGGTTTLAIDMYLQNIDGIDHQADNLKTILGEEIINTRYLGNYRGLGPGTWQADPENPVGINRPGTTINGYDVDGVLTEELRRAGLFNWPPNMSNYIWTALNGLFIQAHLLQQCGYTPETWGSNALQRAMTWLDNHGWTTAPDTEEGAPAGTGTKFFAGQGNHEALDNDVDTIPVINKVLGTSYPVDWSMYGPEYYGKPAQSVCHHYFGFGT